MKIVVHENDEYVDQEEGDDGEDDDDDDDDDDEDDDDADDYDDDDLAISWSTSYVGLSSSPNTC